MPYDRKRFFDAVRHTLFDGRLGQLQVAGMEAILDAAPADLHVKHLAYVLATAKHETAHTMQPIEEFGRGAGRPYGRADPVTGRTYYGRGFVQLTWKANYQKAKDKLGPDFVNRPELALDATLAARIIFRGMAEGWFTGRKLSDYFTPTRSDPVEARRIVNGTDKAATIAGYYRLFLDALLGAQVGPGIPEAPALRPVAADPPPMPEPSPTGARPAQPIGLWDRLGRLFGAAA
jgi:putative chitinase